MRLILRDAEKMICVAIFAAMTILGFANIVVRYVTHYSMAATEELLIHGFLLLTIFGAAIAARAGDHLAVTVFFDLLPRFLRRPVLAISILLSVVLLLLSAWFSWELVTNQMTSGIRSYALQIPSWYYTIGMPFGFILVLIRYLQHSVEMWKSLQEQHHYV